MLFVPKISTRSVRLIAMMFVIHRYEYARIIAIDLIVDPTILEHSLHPMLEIIRKFSKIRHC